MGVALLGLVVAVTCAGLGRWQWSRHVHRLEAVERIEANYDAAPVPLADILPGPDAALGVQDTWRSVAASGTYADGGTVLLRNRPVDGTPALHVLAPLVVTADDGERAVLIIDRGWIPAGREEIAGAVPQPPEGPIEVVARLRPPESPIGRTPPPGQAYTIDPAGVLAQSAAGPEVKDLPVLGAFGVLASEEPAATSVPEPFPRPDTDLGSHLSYAFQWWVFSIGSLVGVGVLARREAEQVGSQRSADPGPSADPPGRGRVRSPRSLGPRGAGRRPSAEEEEDALIDAQVATANVVATQPEAARPRDSSPPRPPADVGPRA